MAEFASGNNHALGYTIYISKEFIIIIFLSSGRLWLYFLLRVQLS